VPAGLATRRAGLRARLAAAGLDEFVDLDEVIGPGVPAGPAAPRGDGASRVLLATVVVLLTVAVLLVAGGTYLFRRYTGSVNDEPLLGRAAVGAPAPGWSLNDPAEPTAAPVSAAPVDKKARGINVLLIGIDQRAGSRATDVRSDTIMIAHVSARRDRVHLVSIPRDSRVVIPAYRRAGYAGGIDKVNAAYQIGSRSGSRGGGVELLGLTLRRLVGFGFDAAAIVTFDGLRAAVDAVGGVDLCVDEETPSIHVGWDEATGRRGVPYVVSPPDYDSPTPVPGMRAQVYHVGCRHFVGWEALDYVRQRELIPDGDYGRQRHQQQLIRALAAKVTAGRLLADPVAADRMLRALGGGVTFDGNGRTLTDWILALRHLDADAVTVVRTNGGRYAGRVIGGRSFEILTDTTKELFDAVRTDTVDDFLAAHPDWAGSAA
jgi:LCP family protein required for cell wall assembly